MLDSGTKNAINDSFITNIKIGKSQVTVSEALKEFYGKETQAKQNMINSIFAGKGGGVKPHPSLNAGGGFGLQKFVKVQKGSGVIDKYRSNASQGSNA